MKQLRALIRPTLTAGILASAMLAAGPASAADADLALIQSYVGDWRGTGELTNSDGSEESVRCRLDITRSSAEKINFDGRCALAGATLSMKGTMAYIEANNRYEAVLTSNTSFSGRAIGRRSGNTVTFNIQSTNEDGETANVRAGFGLSNGKIHVDFVVTNPDGSRLSADVPFDRD